MKIDIVKFWLYVLKFKKKDQKILKMTSENIGFKILQSSGSFPLFLFPSASLS